MDYSYCSNTETIDLFKSLNITTIINSIETNIINIFLNNTFINSNEELSLTCPNGTFHFSVNNSCLDSCPPNYEIIKDKCIFKSIDKELKADDFKTTVRKNISSYVNSSNVINGSNFLAVVLSSDNMHPEDQLKYGISAVDLGNCTNVIKEFYNISKEENLIVLNMETKTDESQKNKSNNNGDKSFNLGKNTLIEIYDYSGRKLDLSICKEEIKVMKYIGDVDDKLDMNSAKSLSNKDIDIFNANDGFFNDICHQYDNSDGKDIILTDRRNEIYQDAKFCQDGCIYNGINYNLNVANCICSSSTIQEEENKNNTNIEKESKFHSLTESFISNLIDFNFDVMRCYNLALNTKILVYNIGFYCLGSMFLLQIIFFFIYLIKKVNPLKNFMLIFKNNNHMNNYHNNNKYNSGKHKNITKAIPPPKNDYTKKIYKNDNNNNGRENRQSDKKKKYITKKKILQMNDLINNISKSSNSRNKLNLQKFQNENDSNKKIQFSNNFAPNINIVTPIINIENNSTKEINLVYDKDEKNKNKKLNRKALVKIKKIKIILKLFL